MAKEKKCENKEVNTRTHVLLRREEQELKNKESNK